MTFTALTPIILPGPFAVAPIALTFTAGDASNGNSFVCDGMTFLIAFNSGGSPYTILLATAADASTGRVADIAADPIAAGAYRVYPIFPINGWRQADLTVHVTPSNVAVKFAACRIAGGAGFAGVN